MVVIPILRIFFICCICYFLPYFIYQRDGTFLLIEHKKKIGRKSCLLSVTEADISSQQQYICSHNEHNENK